MVDTPIQHIGLIMDGNRRWAKQQGMPKIQGHEHGAKRLQELIEGVISVGAKFFTLYAWSTENWKRSTLEQKVLFELGTRYLTHNVDFLLKNGIRVVHLGRSDRLPKSLVRALKKASDKTKEGTTLQLNLCLDYGGRDEIVRALKKIPQGEIDTLSEESFAEYLDTRGIPDPDLIIRTSGEFRLSNFLMWQSAYTELFFVDTYFPDFTRENLKQICKEFKERARRKGK